MPNGEITSEVFEQIRQKIYARYRGIGISPYKDYSYSSFDYFTYGAGGDGRVKHGIGGDNFSGRHPYISRLWQADYRDWFNGGKVGSMPEASDSKYSPNANGITGNWTFSHLQVICPIEVKEGDLGWSQNEPLWVPLWAYLPMQAKHFSPDTLISTIREELNWWKYNMGPFYYPWHQEGLSYSHNRYPGTMYIADSSQGYVDYQWLPDVHGYVSAVELLACRVSWADSVPSSPGGDGFAQCRNLVQSLWPTKTYQGYEFPTLDGEILFNTWYYYKHGAGLDYFLWKGSERGALQIDTWLDYVQPPGPSQGYPKWVVRPYWHYNQNDGMGEMTAHVLDDLNWVLDQMKYLTFSPSVRTVSIYSGATGEDITESRNLAKTMLNAAIDGVLDSPTVGGGDSDPAMPMFLPPYTPGQWAYSFSYSTWNNDLGCETYDHQLRRRLYPTAGYPNAYSSISSHGIRLGANLSEDQYPYVSQLHFSFVSANTYGPDFPPTPSVKLCVWTANNGDGVYNDDADGGEAYMTGTAALRGKSLGTSWGPMPVVLPMCRPPVYTHTDGPVVKITVPKAITQTEAYAFIFGMGVWEVDPPKWDDMDEYIVNTTARTYATTLAYTRTGAKEFNFNLVPIT